MKTEIGKLLESLNKTGKVNEFNSAQEDVLLDLDRSIKALEALNNKLESKSYNLGVNFIRSIHQLRNQIENTSQNFLSKFSQ